MMKSPLRYPGGKTRACKILERHVFENDDIKTLISPFFGGGSFELYVSSKYELPVIANDIFTPLISFWESAKSHNSELCEYCEELRPLNKERYKELQTSLLSEKNPIRQAAQYFAINRCSFSGYVRGGFSQEASLKRFTKSSIDRISKLDLTRFSFNNMDYQDFLSEQKQGFIFADPPYYGINLYGTPFQHDILSKIITQRSSWLLCYNDTDAVKKLYKDALIHPAEWSYGMNKSKKSSEIIITPS